MFNKSFDDSALPKILQKAKTLSKRECQAVYEYIDQNRPKTILEFGVQFGCSTRVFIEIAKWLNYKINLHSWDIIDIVNCADKRDFTMHVENITNKENSILVHNPDLIFLDAHPYILTKNLIVICLKNKINFMCHDVSFANIATLKKSSDSFKNKKAYGAWESYVLSELVSPKILTDDCYEDDKVIVKCIRDLHGLAIVQNKK